MHKNTFWTRLGQLFRPGSRGGDGLGDLPPVADDGLLVDGPEGGSAGSDRPLGRWNRREQALQQLQDGYQRVADLVDAIHKHMAEQGVRSDRIAASLDQLAHSIGDLPGAAREQTHTLEAIATHLEMTTSRTQQLADCIRELPAAMKSQGDATTGVIRQLEVANESSVQMNHTMQSLGQSIDTLHNSGRAQVDLLRKFQLESAERENRLAEVIAQQQRRFTWLFVTAMTLAAGSIVGILLLVWRLRHG